MKNFPPLSLANLSLNLNTQIVPGMYDMIGNIEGADGVVINRDFHIFERLNEY